MIRLAVFLVLAVNFSCSDQSNRKNVAEEDLTTKDSVESAEIPTPLTEPESIPSKITIDDFKNTIWGNDKFDGGCLSTISFYEHGECKIYYCGLDEAFTGNFQIRNDTIFIDEFHRKSNILENSGFEVQHRFKYILSARRIILVYYADLKNDSELIGRDDNYSFEQILKD